MGESWNKYTQMGDHRQRHHFRCLPLLNSCLMNATSFCNFRTSFCKLFIVSCIPSNKSTTMLLSLTFLLTFVFARDCDCTLDVFFVISDDLLFAASFGADLGIALLFNTGTVFLFLSITVSTFPFVFVLLCIISFKYPSLSFF